MIHVMYALLVRTVHYTECYIRGNIVEQVSDGGVHSHINHLFALLEAAKQDGILNSYVHFFSDGRDTSPTSGGD